MKFALEKRSGIESLSTCSECVFFQVTKVSSLGLCTKKLDDSNCSSLVDADLDSCRHFSACAIHVKGLQREVCSLS